MSHEHEHEWTDSTANEIACARCGITWLVWYRETYANGESEHGKVQA